jgi:hypothetical protein
MAAGEDETQPLVGHARRHRLLAGRLVVGPGGGLHGGKLRCALAHYALAPQPVDRPVARHDDDPRHGIARDAVARPTLDRDGERLLDRLLGEIPVTDGTDQRRDRPPEMRSVQAVDRARCRRLAQDAAPSAEAARRA